MRDSEHKSRLEREIATLEAYCEGLTDAIDDFEHQARRCQDRLEREGGVHPQAARELNRLKENRDFNRQELEKSRRRINALNAELAEG